MYSSKDYDNCIYLIAENLLTKKGKPDYGLLSGRMGISIFYYFLGLYSDQNFDFVIDNEVDNCFNAIQENLPSHTFCSGYSGFLWGIDFLNNFGKKKYEIDKKSRETLERFIIWKAEADLKNNNFDFLHGYMGCAFYLMYANKSKFVLKTIAKLEETAHKQDGILKWSSMDPENNLKFNLGLSHGIPSIISFLSKCIEKEIEKERCISLINGAIEYLIKLKKEDEISIFPNFEGGGYPSRLAWCYGDLGIASSIMAAGEICQNSYWKNFAIEIMLKASSRVDLSQTFVYDTCICHGSSGVGLIFNKFYTITKIEDFKVVANLWFDKTLELLNYKNNKAEFKLWNAIDQKWIFDEIGILEGMAGIGLALIYYRRPEIEPKWDQCLLLS